MFFFGSFEYSYIIFNVWHFDLWCVLFYDEVLFWSCLCGVPYTMCISFQIWEKFCYYFIKMFLMLLASISTSSSMPLTLGFVLLMLSQRSCMFWSWSFIFYLYCILSIQVHIPSLQGLKASLQVLKFFIDKLRKSYECMDYVEKSYDKIQYLLIKTQKNRTREYMD